VILTDTALDGAYNVAERIQKMVRERSFNYTLEEQVLELNLTLSIGVVQMEDKDNHVSFLRRADMFLYHAKHSGRDTITADTGEFRRGD